jgi:hypothetical protein
MVMMLLAVVALPAFGQKKARPPSRQEESRAETDAVESRASVAWQEAMQKLGDPYILLSAGIWDGSPERALGRGLGPDERAYTDAIATEVRAAMTRSHPDTNLIDSASLDAARVRAAIDLAESGSSQEAIERLMASENADYGVVLKFVRIGGSAAAPTYRMLVSIKDARQTAPYDVGVFQVTELSNEFLQKTAIFAFDELASTMLNTVAGRSFPKYRVSVEGNGKLTRVFRDLGGAIQELKYVKDDRVRFDQRGPWYTTSVRYDGGPLDLAVELQDIFETQFRLRATVAAASGELLLRTYGTIGAPNWRVLTDVDADDPDDMRASFKDYYEAAGRPSVAILFNEFESVQLESTQTTDPNVAPQFETRLSQRVSPLAASFETELEAVMMDAGVSLKSGTELRDGLRRRLLLDQGRPEDGLVSEAEIEEAMRQMGDFDVYVLGRFYPDSSGGGLAESRMSFKAITRQTKTLLGARSWPSKEATKDPDYGVDPHNETDIARFVGGSILDAYYRNHLKAGNSVDVVVDGAASIRQVQMIADSFEMVVPGVISVPNPSFSAGEGRFTVRYEGSYAELQRGLQEVLGSLMIDTITDQASQELLRVRARPLPDVP